MDSLAISPASGVTVDLAVPAAGQTVDFSPASLLTIDLLLTDVTGLPGWQFPVPAVAIGQAFAPGVVAIRIGSVSGVRATALAGSGVPVVAGSNAALLHAVIAQASANALTSIVSTNLAMAVSTSASTRAYAPTVTAVRSATVNAVRATSTGVAPMPIVVGSNAAVVIAAVATSSAAASSPVVVDISMIFAVIATSTAKANASITSPLNPTVNAVAATSPTRAPIPTITGEAVLTGGGAGLASTLAYAPTVTVPTTTPPAFASSSTLASGSSTTASVPVPTGVAVNDIIIVAFYIQTTQAVTPPTGFVEITDSPAVVTGTLAHNLRVYWKRAIAADTGTYDFTIAAGLSTRQALAARYTGCDPTDPVIVATNSAIKTTSTDPNTPSVTNVTSGANRLWVWIASTNGVGGIVWTMPSGFTQRVAMTSTNGLVLADMPQVVAGSSGSVVGSFLQNSSSGAWLGALKPA